MKKILIVEDEFIEAKNLERILLAAGFEVIGVARSVHTARSIISNTPPDFVLIDICLKGDLTGIDLAKTLKLQNIPFLYLSANTDKTTLEAAKKTRPYGFLVKPFREKDVLVMLDIAIYQHNNGLESLLRSRPHDEKDTGSKPFLLDKDITGIVGQSEKILEVLSLVRIVAPSDTSVLILGESGTGKEMIAQALHSLSSRKNYPFVKVNCAALPPTLIESILFGHERGAFTGAREQTAGKFEQAEKGTLFLDEIGEMSTDIQVKLLRVLQEREIERVGGRGIIKTDVRILAATNRNLETEISKGRFRMDLYYRLNVFPINLPPLRERKEDIPALAHYFIEKVCKKEGRPLFEIPTWLTGKLVAYSWPGNIRELENVLQRLVLLQDDLTNDSADSILFPPQVDGGIVNLAFDGKSDPAQDIKSWQEFEKGYILHVLKKCNGKISGDNGAAQLLCLPAKTLESKMKKLGINKQDYSNLK